MAVPNPALKQVPTGYKYGWHDPEKPLHVMKKGLSAEVVAEISRIKGEPQWMTDLRLKAYRHFEARPMPTWGGDMSQIDFQDIYYYVTATDKSVQSWDDVPDYIRRTYDRLGIPEAEKKYLAGVGGQYDSEVVYHNIRADLEKLGVIFMGTDEALKYHEDLFKEYFGTVIPANDNKLAALNTAVWSGGSFIYVPKGVHVELPLQAYFRINTENMGQFERTLIIADEGSSVHYVEGCTAPAYTTASLHSAVVEIIVKKGARVRYTTIQNWSHNVYNLVTKRAVAYEDAVMEWVDGNLGSHLTMKYPSIYLLGERAHGEVLSIAFAGSDQHQDAGGKVIHAAPNTTSLITSKSISQGHRPHELSRPGQGLPRLPGVEVDGALRRADPVRRGALRHLPVHGDRRGRRHHRARGDRLQGRLRAALLPDEPRHERGRGERHDRQRLHRADRQGAADGVRGRDEPPDPAPDGRRGRLADDGFGDDGRRRASGGRLAARPARRLGAPPGGDAAAHRPGGGVASHLARRAALGRRPAADAPRTTYDLAPQLAEAGVIFSDLAMPPASSRTWCSATSAVARRWTHMRTSGRSLSRAGRAAPSCTCRGA